MTETIAAIATPYGSGGIGVIRISGPRAFKIASQIFSRHRSPENVPPRLTSHTVIHGYILDQGDVVDEVLIIPMEGPRSYTAEDVVEIQAHSGSIVLRRILDLLLDQGVHLAEPGEFTKRAFLNQRIDLTQAEAVADIINARSTSSLKFAASQNLGTLKDEITEMREILLGFLSRLEASIDFPDEVAVFEPSPQDLQHLDDIMVRCRFLIQQHEDACFLKTGIRIAICGEPNVGKSSLMNRLLTKEKSIITEIPGTTRDPIEEGLNIEGIPFVVIDTAGIHETDDLVEIIGIEKARDHIAQADLILFMTEPGKTVSANNFAKMVPKGKRVIHVSNKMDLGDTNAKPRKLTLPTVDPKIPVVKISALLNQGVDELKKKILDLCIRNLDMENDAVIPNLRHKTALISTLSHLESIRSGMDSGQEEETLALDVKLSIDSLGTITGETASLDILDAIFNNFCIGK